METVTTETVTKETVTTETVTMETDALSVVNQLRDLASDPLNRRVIIQDQGCVAGLVLFLDHPNPQVVYSALLALRSLSESSANQQRLGAELGMMLSLHNVMEKSTTPGETKLLASEIYHLLQEAGGGGGAHPPEGGHAHTGDHAHLDGHAPSDGHAPLGGRRRAQFFLGASNKRAKTVILHIQGLDDAARRCQCEEVLLKVRGVVSFTFQMNMKRCIVRMRADLKAEVLACAISSTEVMKAFQVVKGEDGEEVLVPLEENVSSQQKQNLPEYLPEDDSPSQEPHKAVRTLGSPPEGNRWLGAATNFLSRTFYW